MISQMKKDIKKIKNLLNKNNSMGDFSKTLNLLKTNFP